ncbi:MAG TPA: hypothetical protein IAD13_04005 [Bacteroidetes bacterium]|nr:hypothetical protein [Candidatus Limimorpha avicola]
MLNCLLQYILRWAVNDDFFSNFWTPQYHKEMCEILAVYEIQWSIPMCERLNEKIRNQNTK